MNKYTSIHKHGLLYMISLHCSTTQLQRLWKCLWQNILINLVC